MSSGARVAFSKKLALSLLTPAILAGWVIAPMSEAGFQSNFFMSDNGTGYFAFKDDGAVGDPARVNAMGLGASTGGVSGSTTSITGDPLQADVSITPLFAAGSVKHTGKVACTLPGAFDSAANSGAGKWTLNGLVIDGFSDLDLAFTLSVGGGGLPGATAVGGSRYRFNGAALTTSIPKGSSLAAMADGFNMASGECVVLVLNSSSLLLPGTTLSGAGAVSGFLGNSSGACTGGTGDSACATAAKQDNDSTFLTTTTTTTTTTTSTTTTSTTTVIPTVGPWGMMVLGAAFLGAMAWMLKARRAHLQ